MGTLHVHVCLARTSARLRARGSGRAIRAKLRTFLQNDCGAEAILRIAETACVMASRFLPLGSCQRDSIRGRARARTRMRSCVPRASAWRFLGVACADLGAHPKRSILRSLVAPHRETDCVHDMPKPQTPAAVLGASTSMVGGRFFPHDTARQISGSAPRALHRETQQRAGMFSQWLVLMVLQSRYTADAQAPPGPEGDCSSPAPQ